MAAACSKHMSQPSCVLWMMAAFTTARTQTGASSRWHLQDLEDHRRDFFLVLANPQVLTRCSL